MSNLFGPAQGPNKAPAIIVWEVNRLFDNVTSKTQFYTLRTTYWLKNLQIQSFGAEFPDSYFLSPDSETDTKGVKFWRLCVSA